MVDGIGYREYGIVYRVQDIVYMGSDVIISIDSDV